MIAFATMLLETAKACASAPAAYPYPDGCVALANRAADLFETAMKAVAEKERNRFIWTVRLESSGDYKIACIKTLREFTYLGLKDAKDKVEACPCVLLETENGDTAQRMYEQLIRPSFIGGGRDLPRVELLRRSVDTVVKPSSSSPVLSPVGDCPDEYPG